MLRRAAAVARPERPPPITMAPSAWTRALSDVVDGNGDVLDDDDDEDDVYVDDDDDSLPFSTVRVKVDRDRLNGTGVVNDLLI